MDKLFNLISIIIGVAGGIFAQMFGGWDVILWGLTLLIILDYATGIIKAIYLKQLSSEIGFKGLLKKIVILIVVAVANIVQTVIGDNVPIREIVIMFFIANEGISLLENVAEMGVSFPKQVKDILLQLRKSNGGDE